MILHASQLGITRRRLQLQLSSLNLAPFTLLLRPWFATLGFPVLHHQCLILFLLGDWSLFSFSFSRQLSPLSLFLSLLQTTALLPLPSFAVQPRFFWTFWISLVTRFLDFLAVPRYPLPDSSGKNRNRKPLSVRPCRSVLSPIAIRPEHYILAVT